MSIKHWQLAVGPLQTNCYIVADTESKDAVVIDPGGSRNKIIEAVRAADVDVKWILLTHGHFDHSFYAGDLAQLYGAKIGVNEEDISMLTDTLAIAEMYYNMEEYVPFEPTDILRHGDEIALGESKIKVLHTPGHSRGGVCFVTDAGIFCGDTIFDGSIGRTDFPGGSFEELSESVNKYIFTLDECLPLFPGHGPATSVGHEKRTNPFLT